MTGNIQFLQNKQKLWKRTSNFPNEESTRKKKILLSGLNSKTDNEEKSQRSWGKKKKPKQEIIKFEQQRSSGKKVVRTCETTLKGLTYVLLESQSRGERGWVKKNLGKKMAKNLMNVINFQIWEVWEMQTG